MKNTLADLNNHLFAALERINDPDLNEPELIKAELQKARAVSEIGAVLLEAGRLEMEFIQEVNAQHESNFFKPKSELKKLDK